MLVTFLPALSFFCTFASLSLKAMKKKGNILIIDDNEAMLVSLRMLLKNVCEDVQTTTNPNAIPTLMRRKRLDIGLLDMNVGRGINNGNEGMFWLKEIKRTEPDVA